MTERASFEYQGRILYGRDIVELATLVHVPTEIVARALLDDPPEAPEQTRFKMDQPVWAQIGSYPEGRVAGSIANWRRDTHRLGGWEYSVQTAYGTFWFSDELLEEWA